MTTELELYHFRLYVSDNSPGSRQACENLGKICHALGSDRCRVETINIRQDPNRANTDRVFAVPTLIRMSPPPVLRFVGNLSDLDKVWRILDLDAQKVQSSVEPT